MAFISNVITWIIGFALIWIVICIIAALIAPVERKQEEVPEEEVQPDKNTEGYKDGLGI